MGLVLAAATLMVALSVGIVGLQALSRATLGEAVLVLTAVCVLTLGYWYLVWWAETNGVGPLNANRDRSTDQEFEEWEER